MRDIRGIQRDMPDNILPCPRANKRRRGSERDRQRDRQRGRPSRAAGDEERSAHSSQSTRESRSGSTRGSRSGNSRSFGQASQRR
jgi:hypothetical protein